MYTIPQETIDKLKSLREEGKSLRDISKALNISRSTASIYVRKYCPYDVTFDRRTPKQKECHDSVIADRKLGFTCGELSAKYHLSKQTIAKIIAGVELSQEAQDLIHKKQQDRSLIQFKSTNKDWRYEEMSQQISELKLALIGTKNEDILSIKNFKRGMVAELYVRYKLARKGFLVSTPVLLEEGLDVLVTTELKSYRCEIKATTGREVKFIRTGYSKGTYKSENYSLTDSIDVVILVDLIHENLFFVPFCEAKNTMGITFDSYFWKFKDNYDIFK